MLRLPLSVLLSLGFAASLIACVEFTDPSAEASQQSSDEEPQEEPQPAELVEEEPAEEPKTAWSSTEAGIALSAQIDAFIRDSNIDTSVADWRTKLPKPPIFDFAEDAKIFWELDTNQGPMRLRLWHKVAPLHVSSTLYLTRLGFYDDLEFHRVISGFMAQGGCPLGNGLGGPGYGYNGEFQPGVVHDRPGLLSMANTGRPNSDGSQFFLTFVPTPHLDNKHTLFGEIVGAEGMTSLKKLEALGSRTGKTSGTVMLEQARYVVE